MVQEAAMSSHQILSLKRLREEFGVSDVLVWTITGVSNIDSMYRRRHRSKVLIVVHNVDSGLKYKSICSEVDSRYRRKWNEEYDDIYKSEYKRKDDHLYDYYRNTKRYRKSDAEYWAKQDTREWIRDARVVRRMEADATQEAKDYLYFNLDVVPQGGSDGGL